MNVGTLVAPLLVCLACAIITSSCTTFVQSSRPGPTQSELDSSGTATDTWLMTNKSYDGLRYVHLDQINPGNAANLREVCTYDSGIEAPAQSAPVLYRGRIYFSIAQTTVAVDPRTCKEIWRYDWQLREKALSNPNRGVAIKDGKLVRGTQDGYLIALDMSDGKLLWDRKITGIENSQYLSMPAMIVDDTIIYGTAGADWGGRGWIGAFRLSDGDERWRYYALPQPGDPAAGTWGTPEALAHGGGSFWTPVSVDRKRNLVYVPVGNPAPDFWGDVRKGINLYTNSLVALDLETGKVAWWKQFVPHDVHDRDMTQVSPLVTVNGRHLVIVGAKDGRMRIVDRDSHEVLHDVAISRQENGDAPVTAEGVHVCPGLLGGQEWSSAAFDPERNVAIAPMVDWCGIAKREPKPPVHAAGVHFYGGKFDQDPVDEGRGIVAAVDVVSGQIRWKTATAAPSLSNVTATSGGVVFAGDLKGALYVLDSNDGRILVTRTLGASAGGGIFSYEADGKQYVAAVSGPVSGFFGGSGQTKLTLFALP